MHNSIIIVEPTQIVAEGLVEVINKFGKKYQVSIANTFEEMEYYIAKTKSKIVIINPTFISNQKTIASLRSEYKPIKLVGLVYAYHEPKLLSMFDSIINISDRSEMIATLLNKLLTQENQQIQVSSQNILSEREIDVLKLLVTGNANKEITDKLNISTNTVISHRKNISQKIGIKSVSGLTIYAVVNNIILIDSY